MCWKLFSNSIWRKGTAAGDLVDSVGVAIINLSTHNQIAHQVQTMEIPYFIFIY